MTFSGSVGSGLTTLIDDRLQGSPINSVGATEERTTKAPSKGDGVTHD